MANATIKITGDQIQINDVATESTQRNILAKFTGQAAALGKAASDLSDAADSQGGLGSSAQKFGAALLGFSGDLLKGGLEVGGALFDQKARLSTATDAVSNIFGNFGGIGKGFGTLLTTLTKTGEEYVDTFRDISKSGVTFGGDLFAMKNAAGQARMSLEEFRYVIKDSATDLAAIGGMGTKGAKALSDFSNEFFEQQDLTEQLGMMGYNVSDINELLLFQMKLSKRSNFEDKMVRAEAQQSAMNLAYEMDTLSKLTGKQKDQIMSEIEATRRKGQVEAKLRLIEQQFGADARQKAEAALNEAIATAAIAGPDAVAALEEQFALETTRSEQARQGMVALGDAGQELVQMIARITADPQNIPDQVTELTNNFETALLARINDPNFLQGALLGAGDTNVYGSAMAGVLENAGTFETAISKIRNEEEFRNASYAELHKEAQRRAREERKRAEEAGRPEKAGEALNRTMINAEQSMATLGTVINTSLVGENGALQHLAGALTNTADLFESFTPEMYKNYAKEMEKSVLEYKQNLEKVLNGESLIPNSANEEQQANQQEFFNVLAQEYERLKELQTSGNISNEDKELMSRLEELRGAVGALSGTVPDLSRYLMETITQLREGGQDDSTIIKELINSLRENPQGQPDNDIATNLYLQRQSLGDNLPDIDQYRQSIIESVKTIQETGFQVEVKPQVKELITDYIKVKEAIVGRLIDPTSNSNFQMEDQSWWQGIIDGFEGIIGNPSGEEKPEPEQIRPNQSSLNLNFFNDIPLSFSSLSETINQENQVLKEHYVGINSNVQGIKENLSSINDQSSQISNIQIDTAAELSKKLKEIQDTNIEIVNYQNQNERQPVITQVVKAEIPMEDVVAKITQPATMQPVKQVDPKKETTQIDTTKLELALNKLASSVDKVTAQENFKSDKQPTNEPYAYKRVMISSNEEQSDSQQQMEILRSINTNMDRLVKSQESNSRLLKNTMIG